LKNLLILEDHPTSAMVVEEIIGAVVPGLTTRIVESVDQLHHIEPADFDLVVSDLVLPNSEPAEVIDLVSQRFPSSFRMFFTALSDAKIERQIADSGALLLSKSKHYKELMVQVQSFLKRDSVNLNSISQRNEFQSLIQMPGSSKPLTIKQAQVMEQVSLGRTGKEIAKILGMSPDTVNAHIKEAFGRLGVQNRGEAVSNYSVARKLAARLHGEVALAHLQPNAD
jgi:DNA-binding NarL/FixJ family response regulator